MPTCVVCGKNPYKVEACRRLLAKNHRTDILKKMYSGFFAEIKNVNTGKFWDKKLKGLETYSSQDGMTKDRVKASILFTPQYAKRILDIGVGHGFFEEKMSLKRKQSKLYGIDIARRGIEMVKKKYKGTFSVSSVYAIKYPREHFDVVVALEVLEHIPPHRIFSAYREIYRLLSKNGVLIISVPLNEGLQTMKNNPSGHVREYSKELIVSELYLAGFKPVSYTFFFAFKNFYTIKKLLQKILWFKWQPNNIVIRAVKI